MVSSDNCNQAEAHIQALSAVALTFEMSVHIFTDKEVKPLTLLGKSSSSSVQAGKERKCERRSSFKSVKAKKKHYRRNSYSSRKFFRYLLT